MSESADLAEVKTEKIDCPTCKARRQLQMYADGHGICGKCKFVIKGSHAPEREQRPEPSKDKRLVQPDNRSWERLGARNVDAATLRRFGYFRGQHHSGRVQVAPVYDMEGTIVAQVLYKADGTNELIRYGGPWCPPEKFWLFGRHVFGDRYDRKVVVCQSPQDALAASQAIPRVAVVGGWRPLADIEKDLKANYRWLERFQEIVLFFDSTEDGLRKAQECARIFPAGKVKIARLEAYTGPAEALKANRPGDIDSAVWSAATYRPAGIVNASEGKDLFVETAGLLPQWPYPFKNLQARTLGMRPGEVSYHVGGTGASKTTILYQYAAHLATLPVEAPRVSKDAPPQLPRPKVGWLGFEDTVRSVKIGLLSAHARQRLAIYPLPREEIEKVHDSLFGSGHIELYDPETAEWGWEAIRGYVLYMAKALGCHVIMIDPLSFIVAGMDLADNERRAIDKASAELAAIAKQTGTHLHVSHHLNRPDGTPHEEGARITLNHIKGSGGLAHFASNVFAYERDQQGERPDLMRVPALKVRLTGYTSATYGEFRDHQILRYGEQTGVYEETDEPWPIKEGDEGSGKSKGRRPSGFTPEY